MKKYVLGRFVENDLDSIWEYIAQDNVKAADRWIAKIFEAFQALADAPGMGHRRNDLSNLPIRLWPVEDYLILYRHLKQVEIIAVTQGARDIPQFIRRRG